MRKPEYIRRVPMSPKKQPKDPESAGDELVSWCIGRGPMSVRKSVGHVSGDELAPVRSHSG